MEKKMKSKIEKLRGDIVLQDGSAPEITFVLSAILEKQGEIIDYLNSQDQEEYEKRVRIKEELSGGTEHIKAHKEYLATSKQDTPEEWEELETAINIFKNRIKEVDEIGFKVNGQRFVIKRDPSKLKDNK